jgi:hypothetical protein
LIEAILEIDHVDAGLLFRFFDSFVVFLRHFRKKFLSRLFLAVAIVAKDELGDKMLILRHEEMK